ncbi:TrmH family RNA methyltransferase [Cryptosporangium phraense]|uniref:RNA methyltransferase n=1 Tax=Cryptosporangium phraense TaxID=2593070 RepID=A0A545AF10_9ACTN|nr:RNA methyltransferase [Cryptosporangium phraense]TQS39918.1 RNA methyltransferase [Cryptosporangium phraense]
MPPIEITDPDDPRIADYRALTDVALRTAFEPPHGLFIAEGELVLRRAVRAGYAMRSILVDAKRVDQVDTIAPDAPLYAATPTVLEAITGFHVHRGVLGSVHRPAPTTAAELLRTAGKILILEDINTHTNIGAIFRSAAGLGMDAILLSPSCADPLYRRSVRVSMGEVFAVPYAKLEPWPDALDTVRRAGFELLALTPDPEAVSLRDLRVERPALLLGAEGPGLSGKALTAADARVRIPMHRGVDSLNVATAAAIACYELGG